jgi:hypothetical protein
VLDELRAKVATESVALNDRREAFKKAVDTSRRIGASE